jgi:hypothetical protein
MPSFLPLNNAVAQNSVDFNNQTPTNSSGLFRYKVNTRDNNYTFTSADFNSVCILSGGLGGATRVFLNNFGTAPPTGTEIILYSTTGSVYILGSATLRRTIGNLTTGTNVAGKLIHRGNNEWYFASSNRPLFLFTFENCCSYSDSLVQIGTVNNFDPNKFSYVDANLNLPFNGIVLYENEGISYSKKVVNGVTTGDYNCQQVNFDTPYNFYASTDPENPQPVTIYSVSGLNAGNPESLVGNSFFIVPAMNVFSCLQGDRVSGVTYYLSTGGGQSITFVDGYVVTYTL